MARQQKVDGGKKKNSNISNKTIRMQGNEK